jgi:hypothetical protein
MKISFNGQLDDVEQGIVQLRDELHKNPPGNGSAKQVELALLGALDNMQLAKQAWDWPKPTTEAPNQETLEEWLFGDGACEATDSCIVEPDGVCPHGHPSWLRKLGLI